MSKEYFTDFRYFSTHAVEALQIKVNHKVAPFSRCEAHSVMCARITPSLFPNRSLFDFLKIALTRSSASHY